MRALILVPVLVGLCACADKKAPAAAPAGAAASQPSSRPTTKSPLVPEAVESRPLNDRDYIKDPESFPKRAGATRVFLQQDNVNNTRDPAAIPGTQEVVVVAKVGPALGLWRLHINGEKPAELVLSEPVFDKSKKVSADNRRDWYIGAPTVHPDGEHVLFEGSAIKQRARWGNVIGLGNIKTNKVQAIVVDGVKTARNPDVHPDGKTVVVASCNQLRTFTLDAMKGATVQSTELFGVNPVADDVRICAIHRPRYSPDGSFIVFEVVGKYLDDETKKKYNVPEAEQSNDALIEPWIVDADGTNARRLVSDAAYESVSGRLQAGGTKDPDVSPDNEWVVIAHGWSLVMVTKDGTRAETLTAHHVTAGGVTFQEFDPVFTDDGRYVVAASRVLSTEEKPRRAPAGLVVVDLQALNLARTPAAKDPE